MRGAQEAQERRAFIGWMSSLQDVHLYSDDILIVGCDKMKKEVA
jgi:hypothetical protein